MNLLIIGSGGREHAIAWKVAQSPKTDKLYALPGNPGIGQVAENVGGISVEDHESVIRFCREKQIGLAIVGPEIPLAGGIADALSVACIRCFGPSQAAARIESSKAFAKDFMARHGIPTAKYAAFSQLSAALDYLDTVDHPIVIKASGLAAGKGVVLPETLEEAQSALTEIMQSRVFGEAGSEVVIEERISGPEISLMAFTDGTTVVPMVSAQDHKRLLDGDNGPNTGGMGAYAPAPIFTAELLDEALQSVLVPAVDGLRAEGYPFVGVLYAGLMLTTEGIRVLEFNCRFGDPETQAVLPLLETDLVEIAEACVDGYLSDLDIRWKDGASVCVVLASEGYPDSPEMGRRISIGALPENMVCFHAGTKAAGDGIVTSGGRVLGLTAWAESIGSAFWRVYENIGQINFDGMHFRNDIALKALKADSGAGAAADMATDTAMDVGTEKRIAEPVAEYRTTKLITLPTDKLTYQII
ncbi:MAG: phosphoribosylamine--glycine ligase, partial [Chloroflexota bacterium]